MSGSGTIYTEQSMLGHTLGFAPMAFPAQVYVGLDYAAVPPSETVGGVEVSGGGYARMAATFALIDTPANIAANVATVEYPIASGAWGTLGFFELWDAPSGGNRLYWGPLLSPTTQGLPTTITVASGDIVRFSAGTLAVQAATGTGGATSAGAYLPLAGGVLTGALQLAADPTTYLQAATKQYVDAHSGTGGGPGFLALSGGTMLGTLTLAGNATLPLQAVPLQQVDTLNVVNVLNHGAKGDGTTDDTTAILGVLNAYAGKAVVFIPDTGHPYMVSPLTVPTGTDLLLNGTLMLRAGSTNGVLVLQGVNNVTIRGHGIVDGNKAAQTALSAGLNGGNCDNVSVSGITLQNAYAWNFNIVQSTRVRLFGAKFLGGGNSSEFANGCDDCWITNCTVDGPSADMGFAFYGGVTNSGAIGNIFRNASVGVFILADSGQTAACKNITIANNIAYNNYSSGIACDAAAAGTLHQSIIITGNRCYGNNTGSTGGGGEIWVDHTNGAVISSNVTSADAPGASQYGIGLGSNATDTDVIGNAIYNIGNSTIPGTGIYVTSSNDLLASGNVFHEFRAPGYMTSSISGTAGVKSSFVGNSCELPITITLASDTVMANSVASRWTLNNQSFSPIPTNAANDAAAATAGVPVGGVYRNGSVMMVRVA